MLPGLRFLFAATVLSMSVLIFGLGAAALLRAIRQELAHTPIRKPLPEVVFAQPAEPEPPVLALLRVEPATVEGVTEEVETAASPPDALTEQAEPEKLAATQPNDAAAADEPPTETTASIAPQVSEPAVEDVPSPSAADSPPAAADTPAVSTAVPAAAEPSTPLAFPQIGEPAIRLATSGELKPAAEPPPSAKPASAKPERKAVRKRAQVHRAKKKKQRRIAQLDRRRAATVQQPADPFAELTLTRPAH